MCKAVFTVVDDDDLEKVTTVIEYGPFDTEGLHPVQALFNHIEEGNNKGDDECQNEIIT